MRVVKLVVEEAEVKGGGGRGGYGLLQEPAHWDWWC